MIQTALSLDPTLAQRIRLSQTIFAALTAWLAVPVLCLLAALALRQISLSFQPITSDIVIWFFLGTFSPIISWLGFFALLPLFSHLTRCKLSGWVPTIGLGAVLGGVIALVLAMLFDGFSDALFIFLPFTVIGAAHALAFWIALIFIANRAP